MINVQNRTDDDRNFIVFSLADYMHRAVVNGWQVLPGLRDLCDQYQVDFREYIPLAIEKTSVDAVYEIAIAFAKTQNA